MKKHKRLGSPREYLI